MNSISWPPGEALSEANPAWKDFPEEIRRILQEILTARRLDFSGLRPAMAERRIRNRLSNFPGLTLPEYFSLLRQQPDECDRLVEALTINVSAFFREPLLFEILAAKLLPMILSEKRSKPGPTLRLWTAGCAQGEEPYSLAVVLHDLLKKEETPFSVSIFATDIDQSALEAARKGLFPRESLRDLKLSHLDQWFSSSGSHYLISEVIRNAVSFSQHDLLDPKTHFPPEGIFGDFDLITCRNVLIYFRDEYKKIIVNKLARALAPTGFLVLGEAECLPPDLDHSFSRVCEYCQIYRKRF